MTWSEVLATLESGKNLSTQSVHWAMNEILQGNTEIETIKNFLLALKNKGESAEEVSACIDLMYRFAAPINIPDRAVDIVGTGGDGANTINISTTEIGRAHV